jgi:hypothetical protein
MVAIAPDLARTPARSPGAAAQDTDLITVLVLRDIEDFGPQTGLDTLNRVASTARILGIPAAGYPLLHGLADAHLLESVPGTPPSYRITGAGSHEAERLARLCWPRLTDEVERLSRKLAPASPRGVPPTSFATEWADESTDRSVRPQGL